MKIKKLLKMFLVTIAVFSFYSPSLFAQTPTYHNISMTSNEGNLTAKPEPYTYGWDEQPWLFLKLKADSNSVESSTTNSNWKWSGSSLSNNLVVNGTGNNLWNSFDLTYWKNIRQLGTWTIDVDTTLYNTVLGSSILYKSPTPISFNIVPEPASMILYVLGSLSLATGFFRKKKS